MEWVFELPPSGLQRQLFGDKAMKGESALYDKLTVPELPEMQQRSDGGAPRRRAGLRAGIPRDPKPDRTYWLHEQVSITAEGPGPVAAVRGDPRHLGAQGGRAGPATERSAIAADSQPGRLHVVAGPGDGGGQPDGLAVQRPPRVSNTGFSARRVRSSAKG